MDDGSARSVSRKELYDLVWSTPMRRLAGDFGLSDVGLAKVCERYAVPRPPVGYWAKLKHGRKVRKTPLPKRPEDCPEVVEIVERPIVEKQEYEFFDPGLKAKCKQICAGQGIVAVKDSLHGSHDVIKRTKQYLEISARESRNKWGGYADRERYEGSHLYILTEKEHWRRALYVLDAAVKTVLATGAELVEPTDRWNKLVSFNLLGYEFGLSITERQRQVKHELTAEEKKDLKKYGRHYGPKRDMVPTGELRLRLTGASNNTAQVQFQDGKKRKIEDAIGDLARQVVLWTDRHLRWEADRIERKEKEIELAKQRREEEERRRAEQASRDQLFELSGRWHSKARLEAFLAECRRRVEVEDLSDDEADLLRRWLAWASDVSDGLDPFGESVASLPRFTHGE